MTFSVMTLLSSSCYESQCSSITIQNPMSLSRVASSISKAIYPHYAYQSASELQLTLPKVIAFACLLPCIDPEVKRKIFIIAQSSSSLVPVSLNTH